MRVTALRWWVEGNRVVYVIPRDCLGKAAGVEDCDKSHKIGR